MFVILKQKQIYFIYLNMEFNDNAGLLYCDPNAYIQNWGYGAQAPQSNHGCANEKPHCQKPPQKVVFSEPYESVPNFYINNNFKKGNCACIPKPKPKCPPPKPPFSFDLKNILPLLSGLFKGGAGGGGIGGILSMLNQNSSGEEQGGEGQGGSIDFSSMLKTLSNTGGLDGILNLFKPKNKADGKNFGNKNAGGKNTNFGLFKNETNSNNSNLGEQNNEDKSSDFVIKNYSRVE